jgi:phytoene dehydrogenase-like protein
MPMAHTLCLPVRTKRKMMFTLCLTGSTVNTCLRIVSWLRENINRLYEIRKRDFDAVIVGSGPNGLAAAILLQQNGLSVLLLEGKDKIGGGLRTEALTLPGFLHDVCSAIHPMAAGSPYFQTLPLHEHGLEYIYPEIPVAHPFDNGTAAILKKSVAETAGLLGEDRDTYIKLLAPLVKNWPGLAPDLLGPLTFPKHPVDLANLVLMLLPLPLTSLNVLKRKEAKGIICRHGST